MKRTRNSISAIALVCALVLPASAATDTPQAIAARLLDRLDAGQYDQAEAMFNAQMQQHVPTDKLKAVWQSLPPAGKRDAAELSQKDGMQVIRQTLHRGATAWTFTVAVDAQGKVSGMFVQPQQNAAPIPAVPADAGYSEREVSVGAEGHPLGGTLAMPKGKGPFPAVVLVHGSGPNDREETIGPNHVFTDIARGLAAQGIAVLRYEKRTRARPQDYKDGIVTIDSETTDDAVAAVKALATTPGIDPKRVFVFGHSLGAMVAPRIAQRAGQDVIGVIELSGPSRKLIDIIPYQQRYMAKLQGKSDDPQALAGIAKAESDIAAIRGNAKPDDTALGMRVDYWRSVDAIDPIADNKALRVPALLLHGDRDFQVPMEDWTALQQAFSGNKRFTMKLYPSLNHLGIAGSGTPSMAEYAQPGHVDARLINDAAAWIKAH
ncbi:alpha/beta fold hydrolase [Solilutibacter silvestris]|uniref:alpha/beta hydrolase n=1 Tax=Solilutibacter silvestris TaxID=1645665 RepID=UPI003D32DDF3